jgi:hypothetical protein
MPGNVQRNINAELHLMHTGEPCCLAEAEGDAAWRNATGDGLHQTQPYVGARRLVSWPPPDHSEVGVQAQEERG